MQLLYCKKNILKKQWKFMKPEIIRNSWNKNLGYLTKIECIPI